MNREVRRNWLRPVLQLVLIAIFMTQPGGSSGHASAVGTTVVLVGAGDISKCNNDNDAKTARLLDNIAGTVFTTGDNVYNSGSSTEYRDCYGPTWGRHKSRTKPVPGNVEYNTSGASGYYNYFSNIPRNYYVYTRGDWRIYALNSEIDASVTSAQATWLKNDLLASRKNCVMAYWHRPRWSSGSAHGSDTKMQAIWNILYDAGAELVVAGHEHSYERFAPMNKTGQAVNTGLQEFVVGTGGSSHTGFGTILPASRARNSTTYGVLKLTLSTGSYAWQFVPIAGSTFTDSGSKACH